MAPRARNRWLSKPGLKCLAQGQMSVIEILQQLCSLSANTAELTLSNLPDDQKRHVALERSAGRGDLDCASSCTGWNCSQDHRSVGLEVCRRAAKRNAGRALQIVSENSNLRSCLAHSRICFHERAKTHIEAE